MPLDNIKFGQNYPEYVDIQVFPFDTYFSFDALARMNSNKPIKLPTSELMKKIADFCG